MRDIWINVYISIHSLRITLTLDLIQVFHGIHSKTIHALVHPEGEDVLWVRDGPTYETNERTNSITQHLCHYTSAHLTFNSSRTASQRRLRSG